jgi:hypothetical protein
MPCSLKYRSTRNQMFRKALLYHDQAIFIQNDTLFLNNDYTSLIRTIFVDPCTMWYSIHPCLKNSQEIKAWSDRYWNCRPVICNNRKMGRITVYQCTRKNHLIVPWNWPSTAFYDISENDVFDTYRASCISEIDWTLYMYDNDKSDYLVFYVPLKNFSLLWKRHHCRWRAAKFRPMLGAQGLWEVVPHLLWHGVLVFPVSSEGPPHSVASHDTHGDAEDLFLPRSSRVWYIWMYEEQRIVLFNLTVPVLLALRSYLCRPNTIEWLVNKH